jgi:hypothetical protein
MPHPIVIIELVNNKFEDLYSNSELSYLLVNRNERFGEAITISGPHEPTGQTPNLSTVLDGVTILQNVLEHHGESPLSAKEEKPL